MRRLTATSLVLPFVLAACAHRPQEFDATPQAPQPAPQGVSLAGTWTYNPDASDQPGQMSPQGGGFGGGRGGPPPGGGFGGRGGFGGGMGGRGGRGGRGPEGGPGSEQGDSTLRTPPERLVITQTDSTMTIGPRTPRDSVTYTLYFDGRDVAAPALGGSQMTMRGRWNKNRFEVSRQLPSGGTLTEGYEITKHGQRLVIHVKVSGVAPLWWTVDGLGFKPQLRCRTRTGSATAGRARSAGGAGCT
ncbi:MAG: hypothetical protein ABSG61_15565, partial [Gemmatimonadales bacterium]